MSRNTSNKVQKKFALQLFAVLIILAAAFAIWYYFDRVVYNDQAPSTVTIVNDQAAAEIESGQNLIVETQYRITDNSELTVVNDQNTETALLNDLLTEPTNIFVFLAESEQFNCDQACQRIAGSELTNLYFVVNQENDSDQSLILDPRCDLRESWLNQNLNICNEYNSILIMSEKGKIEFLQVQANDIDVNFSNLEQLLQSN